MLGLAIFLAASCANFFYLRMSRHYQRAATTNESSCPPAPVLSIRLALVGNEFLQQFPLIGYGGIETGGTTPQLAGSLSALPPLNH